MIRIIESCSSFIHSVLIYFYLFIYLIYLLNDTSFKSIFQIFSHELIWIKILESFFESWVDLNQNILEAFWVVSRFESNFRNPFWVMSWFESIPVKPLWVMSWVESKLSDTKLIRIKNILSRTHVCGEAVFICVHRYVNLMPEFVPVQTTTLSNNFFSAH